MTPNDCTIQLHFVYVSGLTRGYSEATTLDDILLHDEDVEKGRGTARSTQEEKVGTNTLAALTLDDAVVLLSGCGMGRT